MTDTSNVISDFMYLNLNGIINLFIFTTSNYDTFVDFLFFYFLND